MTQLEYLSDKGRDLVKEDDQFPQEEGSEPPHELQDHINYIEIDGGEIDLDLTRLDDAIEASKELFDTGRDQQKTALDSNLAPIVHECIDIPPRIAALPGVWQYFTLFVYPDLVTTRWSRDDDLQEKFLGEQKDLYSNYLARLWWGAELTYDSDRENYIATHRLFNKQRLVNYVLDSSFRRYRPAARAFANVLWNQTTSDIGTIAKRFNDSLSTIQLEARSEDELIEQLKTIKSRV